MLLFTWFFQAIEILQNHLLRGFQVIDLNSFSSKSFFKQSKSALKNGCNQLKFLHCDMKNRKLKKNSDFNDTTSDFHHSQNCLPNHIRSLALKNRRFSLAKAGSLFGPFGAGARWVRLTRIVHNFGWRNDVILLISETYNNSAKIS